VARLIQAPCVESSPRLLRTPGPRQNGAVRPPSGASSADSAPSPEPIASPDPELLRELETRSARLAEASARVEVLEAELASLRDEIEQERRRAREEGLAAGLAEGRERGREERQQEIERLRVCVDALARRVEDRLADEEDSIVEAVMASLAKILLPTLATRESVAAAVRAVCEQIRERDALVVRLSPEDHALLAAEPEALGSLGERVTLEADPTVTLGGCVVESSAGTLDGRLEVQLERLRDALILARSVRREASS